MTASLTVAPDTNPVPARLVIETVAPCAPVFGVIDVIVGAAGVMVNPLASRAVCPSGFSTITLQFPVNAFDGSAIWQVIFVGETTTTLVP